MLKGNNIHYYSKDGLGSVVNLTDSNGQVIESYTYDEYGNISAPSQIGNRYLYTAREYDPEINLYYYRARYYDPSIGRFLQTDPIGYQGGINLYTYAKNNPINWVDPWGLNKQKPWWKEALDWWLWESALPGWHYGQPMSEWGPYGPTGGFTPMIYTEEAGGAWMWWERIAIGTSGTAATGALAGGAIEAAGGTKTAQIIKLILHLYTQEPPPLHIPHYLHLPHQLLVHFHESKYWKFLEVMMYKITKKIGLFLGKKFKQKTIMTCLKEHPTYNSLLVDGIRVIGDEKFISQTFQALDLLKCKDNDIYNRINKYIELIIFVEKQKGFFVTAAKTYGVNIQDAYEGDLEWYASLLAFWSTRSEIWHHSRINNPFFRRKKTEEIRKICMSCQKEVLKKLGREEIALNLK